MMKPILLDASVLIAATEPSDMHHTQAVAIMTAAAPGSMLIHPLNLAEVLVGGVRKGVGEQLREAIVAAGVVTTSGDVAEPLSIATVRVDTRLKLPDAVLLATAQALEADLATFDESLAAAHTQLSSH
jgi:predicted nucleic acid-binding protein